MYLWVLPIFLLVGLVFGLYFAATHWWGVLRKMWGVNNATR
jgi:hypothetical protein